MPALYFAAFYAATRGLALNAALSRGVDILGIIILTLSGIRFLVAMADVALKYLLHTSGNPEKERSLRAIAPIFKVTVWMIGLVFLLDNLGFEISAVVAGLGIGGIAVALAAQAVLGDLFSYVAIVFDRPFEIGDFIIIGEHMGTIEHVGIKTTRIRSLSGEQVVFSNSDLTNSRIRNYKRMITRRVLFKFGVIYSTADEQLKEIPAIVKRIIEAAEGTTFDRAHFFSFGDFSLDFEVVYYVQGNDYNRYMDVQQTINLNLKEEFARRNIEFAFPTQTLYLQR
ncbi:mechanosensitive ion channel family protein [Anaeroselena agilis]|uniref:Mechanosensitive ion channel family protein n=1 Tax=Anaeroselena agilis TaxID=3063788 RepID=A0ABU3P3B2_9FIRM|nr:mechanosensitive ion channel family protein [Selenomonadales bacterium 4137-cl]